MGNRVQRQERQSGKTKLCRPAPQGLMCPAAGEVGTADGKRSPRASPALGSRLPNFLAHTESSKGILGQTARLTGAPETSMVFETAILVLIYNSY